MANRIPKRAIERILAKEGLSVQEALRVINHVLLVTRDPHGVLDGIDTLVQLRLRRT
jgi:hypothetical protein